MEDGGKGVKKMFMEQELGYTTPTQWKFVNCTREAFALKGLNGESIFYRAAENPVYVEKLYPYKMDYPLHAESGAVYPVEWAYMGEVHNLPKPAPNTYYIVSLEVAFHPIGKWRPDLLMVDNRVEDAHMGTDKPVPVYSTLRCIIPAPSYTPERLEKLVY